MIRSISRSGLVWPLATLLAILVYNAFVNPTFFAVEMKNGQLYGSVIDICFRATPLILVALGMTLVIATSGVDLSVGAVAALSASSAALGFAQGLGWEGALALALGVGLVVGSLNALLIAGFGLQPIVASLIAMVAGRGVAQLLVDGQIATLSDPSYLWIGTGGAFGLPFSLWLALIMIVVLALLTRKTSAGLFVEAVGSNATASRYIGLSVSRVKWFVYALAGLMAALSGVVMSANIRAVDVNNLGLFLELDAILAVVIGGTRLTGGRFTLLGSALGALIIQTVATTINTQGVAVELMLMVKAAVVIAICLAQSDRLRIRVRKARLQPEMKAAS
ncbi:MAG: ABC transporter permease [Bdellovibrionota bacterium]